MLKVKECHNIVVNIAGIRTTKDSEYPKRMLLLLWQQLPHWEQPHADVAIAVLEEVSAEALGEVSAGDAQEEEARQEAGKCLLSLILYKTSKSYFDTGTLSKWNEREDQNLLEYRCA